MEITLGMSDSPALLAPSATPLVFERRPSAILTAFIIAAHALAASPLLFLPLPWFLALAWLTLVLGALVRELTRHGLPARRRFVGRVRWGQDGRWQLETGDGRLWPAEAVAALVSPWLCIVHWRRPVGGARSLVLPADSLDADSHRRLRRALEEGLALRGRAARSPPGTPGGAGIQ